MRFPQLRRWLVGLACAFLGLALLGSGSGAASTGPQLTGSNASVSSTDSERFQVVEDGCALWLVDAETGKETSLSLEVLPCASAVTWTFSPDYQYLLLRQEEDLDFTRVTYSLTRTAPEPDPVRILDVPDLNAMGTFASDSSSIAFDWTHYESVATVDDHLVVSWPSHAVYSLTSMELQYPPRPEYVSVNLTLTGAPQERWQGSGQYDLASVMNVTAVVRDPGSTDLRIVENPEFYVVVDGFATERWTSLSEGTHTVQAVLINEQRARSNVVEFEIPTTTPSYPPTLAGTEVNP